MILPFSRKLINKIPCASKNTEAKTLPADVCIFGCFWWLSTAVVHSADCWFDSGVKWWIPVSSIVTYLCKPPFCWVETVANNALNCRRIVAFDWLWANTSSTLNTAFSLINVHKNGEYTAFWYVQFLCYLTRLQFRISQNEFVEFFGVFHDPCRIQVTWAFSNICVGMTMFKVRMPPFNHCFWRSQSPNNTYQAIALLEQYFFPIRKQWFINTRN